MADFASMVHVLPRFPNHTFIAFETGGHLIRGHGDEMDAALDAFIAQTSSEGE